MYRCSIGIARASGSFLPETITIAPGGGSTPAPREVPPAAVHAYSCTYYNIIIL